MYTEDTKRGTKETEENPLNLVLKKWIGFIGVFRSLRCIPCMIAASQVTRHSFETVFSRATIIIIGGKQPFAEKLRG